MAVNIYFPFMSVQFFSVQKSASCPVNNTYLCTIKASQKSEKTVYISKEKSRTINQFDMYSIKSAKQPDDFNYKPEYPLQC